MQTFRPLNKEAYLLLVLEAVFIVHIYSVAALKSLQIRVKYIVWCVTVVTADLISAVWACWGLQGYAEEGCACLFPHFWMHLLHTHLLSESVYVS